MSIYFNAIALKFYIHIIRRSIFDILYQNTNLFKETWSRFWSLFEILKSRYSKRGIKKTP